MKIWMPTSNDYVWAANASLQLLHKYWPDHPVVDVTCFEVPPLAVFSSRRCNVVQLGEQTSMSWTQAAIRYLESDITEDMFLLMLDDYAICAPVDAAGIWQAFHYILRDSPDVCSVALTWQPCGPVSPESKVSWCDFPRWDYSFNTQAAAWRRTDMLRILKNIPPETSIRNVEISGSQYFNHVMYPEGKRTVGWNIPRPHNASGFVDETDKSGWLMAYNNLVRMGQRDARHTEWLSKELAS